MSPSNRSWRRNFSIGRLVKASPPGHVSSTEVEDGFAPTTPGLLDQPIAGQPLRDLQTITASIGKEPCDVTCRCHITGDRFPDASAPSTKPSRPQAVRMLSMIREASPPVSTETSASTPLTTPSMSSPTSPMTPTWRQQSVYSPSDMRPVTNDGDDYFRSRARGRQSSENSVRRMSTRSGMSPRTPLSPSLEKYQAFM